MTLLCVHFSLHPHTRCLAGSDGRAGGSGLKAPRDCGAQCSSYDGLDDWFDDFEEVRRRMVWAAALRGKPAPDVMELVSHVGG